MEIVKDYDKLCQKIHELRIGFYRQHGIQPNMVNVGHDEFYTLKKGNRFLVENDPKNDGDYTVFGLKIKRVAEDSYLAVGLVIE